MERLFAALPANYKTLGTNQYIAILHTRIGSSADDAALQLTLSLDSHYCAYFASHPSSWQLWLSDPLRERLAASYLGASVDDKPTKIQAADFTQETLMIDLPPGLGPHSWKLEVAKNHH